MAGKASRAVVRRCISGACWGRDEGIIVTAQRSNSSSLESKHAIHVHICSKVTIVGLIGWATKISSAITCCVVTEEIGAITDSVHPTPTLGFAMSLD